MSYEEDMFNACPPCPLDICDGTGMVWNEETREEEACPHMKDPWAAEPEMKV